MPELAAQRYFTHKRATEIQGLTLLLRLWSCCGRSRCVFLQAKVQHVGHCCSLGAGARWCLLQQSQPSNLQVFVNIRRKTEWSKLFSGVASMQRRCNAATKPALQGVTGPSSARCKGRACFSGGLLRERDWAAEPPPNRDAASLARPLGTSSGSCAALCVPADALATPA